MAAALTLEIRVGGGRCKIYCGYNTGSWIRYVDDNGEEREDQG